ncbi:hypothetical protein GYB22_06590 [bacterium]|nr:hypothetical protein [bacterium]
MNRDNQNIDDILFNSANGAEMNDPALGWDSFLQHKKKKNRGLLLLWMIPAILLLGSGLWVILDSPNQELVKKEPTLKNEAPIITPNLQEKFQEESVNLEKSEISSKTEKTPQIQNSEAPIALQPVTSQTDESTEPLETIIAEVPDHLNEPVKSNSNATNHSPALAVNAHGDEIPFDLHHAGTVKQRGFSYRISTPEFEYAWFDYELKDRIDPFSFDFSKWVWQVSAGTYYTLPQFKINEQGRAYIHKRYPSIRQEGETGIAGFGFHLGVGRQFNRFIINTGIGLVQQKTAASYHYNVEEVPLIDIDNRIFDYQIQSPSPFNLDDIHRYSMIEIPIGLEIEMLENRRYYNAFYVNYINQFLMGIKGDLPNAVNIGQIDQLSVSNYSFYSNSLELGLNLGVPLKSGNILMLRPSYRLNGGIKQIQGYYNTGLNNFGLQCILRGGFE